MKKLSYLLAASAILLTIPVSAQNIDTNGYNKNDIFGPITWPVTPGGTRSANGQPGANYWSNRADYLIHASLNEDKQDTTITGDVTITYTNNSPDKLDYLWLQLDQNLFKPGSRGDQTTPIVGDRFDVQGFKRGGDHIASVSITYQGKTYTVEPVITDTRMQLRLNTPMNGNGDKIEVKIKYSFSIPFYGADRMGRQKFKQGYVYEIAQWYPRMCVYDDNEGWNTLPYMGLGEFYCDYGDFDYYITTPADMIVAGSGDLQNGSEVLTATQQSRLAEAYNSNKTLSIIKASEVALPETHPFKRTLTWHFKMQNSRDVSWAASKAFIWDAAKVNLPGGRRCIAMAVYPVESAGNDSWGRSVEYLKNSMEIYSQNYFEYPWNSATAVAGVALGMEYPGIVFSLNGLKNGDLWNDITHEIGHNWFPMIVGSNERKYMWMDEGLNTFINYYATASFKNGVYNNEDNLRQVIGKYQNFADPMMIPPEAIGTDASGYGTYYLKAGQGLAILRNNILGPERFDYAFREYIKHWAYKHPLPYDFFRIMNDASGEDLNWFFKPWFFTNWSLDQAVTSISYIRGNATKGAIITLANKGKLALPVDVQINQANGKTETLHFDVNIWQRGGVWEFKYPSTSRIKTVVVDPNNDLPDTDRSNNTYSGM